MVEAGKWGESVMSAHPDITNKQAKEMARYILSLADEKPGRRGLPLTGRYVTNKHRSAQTDGRYVFMASYTDLGSREIQSLIGQEQLILRHTKVEAEAADFKSEEINVYEKEEEQYAVLTGIRDGSYLGFRQLDLTDIKRIHFSVYFAEDALGGDIEIRSGATDGKLLGKATMNKLKGTQEGWIELYPTTGIHNVYVVFKNPEDTQAPICVLDWILFQPKEFISAN